MKRLFCLAPLAFASIVAAQESVPAYVQSPSIETSNFRMEGGEIPAWVIPRAGRFVGTVPLDGNVQATESAVPRAATLPAKTLQAPLTAVVPPPPGAAPSVYFAPSSLNTQSLDSTKARTSSQWGEMIRVMRKTADDLQLQAVDAISTAERQRNLAIVKEQLTAIADLERAQKALDATQKQMADILRPVVPFAPVDRPFLRPQSYQPDAVAPPVAPAARPGELALKADLEKVRSELDDLKKSTAAKDAQLQIERAQQVRLRADLDDQARQRAAQAHRTQLAEMQFTENTAKAKLDQTLKSLQETQAKAARELEQGNIAARAAVDSRKEQERALQGQRDEVAKTAAELKRLAILKQAATADLDAQQASKRESEARAAREREAALELQRTSLTAAQAGLQKLRSEQQLVAAQVTEEAARRDKEKRLADEQSERARSAQAQLEKIQGEAQLASKTLIENQSKAKALAAQEEEINTTLQLARSEAKKLSALNDKMIAASAPAGSAGGYVMLPQDRLVSTTLARWAAQDNFSLYWTAPDVPTPPQAWALTSANTPHEAIDLAIAALGNSGIKVKLCEHTNRTLSVIKPDESCNQKQ